MVGSQAKRALKQRDSEMLKRADNCEGLALVCRIVSLSGGKLLGEVRDRALYFCGVELKQNCANCDIRRICIQRERRYEIRVREARCGTNATLELSESLDVFASEVHWLRAFTRSGHIVQRKCQRSLLVDDVGIEVNEAEERL